MVLSDSAQMIPTRSTPAAAAILTWLLAVPLFAHDSVRPDGVDWLGYVPGDARFYVELKNLDGIRSRFQKLGIWKTVREITAQEPGATSRPWRRRTQAVLDMGPETAISELLGHRAALFAARSASWERGVILAELPRRADIRRLLRRWKARPRPALGEVRRYVLRNGVLLAVLDRLLVLGTADDRDGLWERSVLLLSGKQGPTLRGHAGFAAMRARLQGGHDGLIYAAWPEGDPFALAGCQRLIIGFSFTESTLRCEVHGQRRAAREPLPPYDADLVSVLPEDTLAAWFGSLGTAASGNVFEFLASWVSEPHSAEDSAPAKLGPRAAVVVGPDPSAAALMFHLPAVTVLCESEAPRRQVERLDQLIGSLVHLIEFMGASSTDFRRDWTDVVTRRLDGIEVHSVAIGPILAKRVGLEFLNRLEICWAAAGNRILVSSSSQHLVSILRARGRPTAHEGQHPSSASTIDQITPASKSAGEPLVEWTLVRGHAVSQLIGNWLDWVFLNHYESLEDTWWQSWARARLSQRARFGVALKNDPGGGPRAMVAAVETGTPAAGILRVGDLIERADGRPLPKASAPRAVAERYAARGASTTFRVDVLRDGKPLALEIPVPPAPDTDLHDFKPVRALMQLRSLLSGVESATLARYGSDPGRLDLRVLVRWRCEDVEKR